MHDTESETRWTAIRELFAQPPRVGQKTTLVVNGRQIPVKLQQNGMIDVTSRKARRAIGRTRIDPGTLYAAGGALSFA